jgi:hypothetical protein
MDELLDPPPPPALDRLEVRITRRVLPDEDVSKAIAAGGPLQDLGVDPEKLKQMSIGVVERNGVVVAYWVVFFALHAEPLWIHPDHRKNPRVVANVVEQMREIVQASNEPVAYVEIDQADADLIGGYAHRIGFQEAPGKLYYAVLPEVEEH